MIWKTLIFAFLAVGVLAQEYEIPEQSRQRLIEMLSQQYRKNGTQDVVADVEASTAAFEECVKQLVDINQVTKEIEGAQRNGALGDVFKKYCAKSSQLNNCINSLLDGATPSVDFNAHAHLDFVKKSTNQLIDFMCYKDGVRITLFITEGGPECLQSRPESISTCFDKLRSSIPNAEAAKSLSTVEKCAIFDELSSCLVTILEQCSNPTPGNLAESLVKFIHKILPCPKNESLD